MPTLRKIWLRIDQEAENEGRAIRRIKSLRPRLRFAKVSHQAQSRQEKLIIAFGKAVDAGLYDNLPDE